MVSQFTLYANTMKGRRPSWNAAAPGAVAEPLVEGFATALEGSGRPWDGACSAPTWRVELVNDGPVTVLLEL